MATWKILAGSYTDSIHTLEFDPTPSHTPTLKLVSQVNVGHHPSWIDAHPSDRSLVVTGLEQDDGQIVVVKYDENGKGQKVEEATCSSGGAAPCTLLVTEHEIIVGNVSPPTPPSVLFFFFQKGSRSRTHGLRFFDRACRSLLQNDNDVDDGDDDDHSTLGVRWRRFRSLRRRPTRVPLNCGPSRCRSSPDSLQVGIYPDRKPPIPTKPCSTHSTRPRPSSSFPIWAPIEYGNSPRVPMAIGPFGASSALKRGVDLGTSRRTVRVPSRLTSHNDADGSRCTTKEIRCTFSWSSPRSLQYTSSIPVDSL